MNDPKRPMKSVHSNVPFPIAYLLAMACQLPVWLCAGLLWAALMIVTAGAHPFNALVGGINWGFFMWVMVGNLMAIGLAWRRSTEFPVSDQTVLRTALQRICRKRPFIVLAESVDEMILGPKWALIRFRLQEVRMEFLGSTAVLSAPILSFGAIRKALEKELAEAPASAQQASQCPINAERIAEPNLPRD